MPSTKAERRCFTPTPTSSSTPPTSNRQQQMRATSTGQAEVNCSPMPHSRLATSDTHAGREPILLAEWAHTQTDSTYTRRLQEQAMVNAPGWGSSSRQPGLPVFGSSVSWRRSPLWCIVPPHQRCRKPGSVTVARKHLARWLSGWWTPPRACARCVRASWG